jgi:hypothetical protein
VRYVTAIQNSLAEPTPLTVVMIATEAIQGARFIASLTFWCILIRWVSIGLPHVIAS